MPSSLIRITSLEKSLPKAEKQVAAYIVKNPDKIPFLSVSELAGLTGVSVASVSRLSKKVGYGSFQELKISLAQDSSNNFADIYEAMRPGDTDKDIVKKVFGGNIKSLEDTLAVLDTEGLIRAGKLIADAERMLFLGIGGSGYIAQDAAMRFSQLGFRAEAYVDSYQMLVSVCSVKAKDVVVGISHSGRSRNTVEGLKLAHDNGAVTIGISNYLKSPLSRISDILLRTSFPENKVRAAALSSRISQMCIIDSLYVLAACHRKKLSNTKQLDSVAETLLRI